MRAFAAILVCAVLLAAQPASVENAWRLLAQGKRDEAVALLRGIIRTKPADGESHLLLGSILSESGDTATAMVHLREAVRLRPKDPMAHNALGETLKAAGKPG